MNEVDGDLREYVERRQRYLPSEIISKFDEKILEIWRPEGVSLWQSGIN